MRAFVVWRDEIGDGSKDMIHEVHVSVRLAVFQMMVVILGVFMTRAVFMGTGFPDTAVDWNDVAMLVRNYGYVLLLAPAGWAAAAMYFENYGTGFWSRRWMCRSRVRVRRRSPRMGWRESPCAEAAG